MRRENQLGFTYLALLFAVAMASIALAAVGEVWSTQQQREREKELLFVGHQFRQAIQTYYERSPGTLKQYPKSLDDLLLDRRYMGVQRLLRQVYIDPMTGGRQWGLVTAPEGGIMGVYSLSNERAIKTAGFAAVDADLEGKTKYSEWRFIYRLVVKPNAPPKSQ